MQNPVEDQLIREHRVAYACHYTGYRCGDRCLGMWRRFNFPASHLASAIAHKCYGHAKCRHHVTGATQSFAAMSRDDQSAVTEV
jgi:hypothetical protein